MSSKQLDIQELKHWAEVQGYLGSTYMPGILLKLSYTQNIIFIQKPDNQQFMICQAPRFLDSITDFKSKVENVGLYDPSTGLLHVSNIETLEQFVEIFLKLQEVLGSTSTTYTFCSKACKPILQFNSLFYKDKQQMDFKINNYGGPNYSIRTGYLSKLDKERLKKFDKKLEKSLSIADAVIKENKLLDLDVMSDMTLIAGPQERVALKFDINLGVVTLENSLNYKIKEYNLESVKINQVVKDFIESFKNARN